MQKYFCAKFPLKLLKRRPCFRIGLRCGRHRLSSRTASCKTFHLPDAHSSADSAPSEFEASHRISDRKQCATVTCSYAAVFEQFLDLLVEIQKSQRVGDCCTVFARAFSNLLLREMKA